MSTKEEQTHPLVVLSKRYPQLRLPIREGEKDTQEYKDVVLAGKEPEGELEFTLNENDTLETIETPAGPADVLYLFDRQDFEHAVQSLAYRCEPVAIPASTGAMTISGLINWEKINAHEDDLEEFLSDKANYLDSIILLSNGPYSAVSAEQFNLSDEDWTEKSKTIREYHELTHFTSRALYPENQEAIRDEVIADMMGIMAAFGYYDTEMARIFLGTEGEEYREGGRLQNYIGKEPIESAMTRANQCIDCLDAYLKEIQFSDIFSLLKSIESNKIGIEYSEVQQ